MADYKFRRPEEVQELMRIGGLDPHADVIGPASEVPLVRTKKTSEQVIRSLETLFDGARESVVKEAQAQGNLKGALIRDERDRRSE